MKKQFSILLLLLPLLCFTQEKGIIFEHAANWEAVKAKAQKDNKYIFVDCYTTWCVPCKRMDNEVFSQEKVGDFFNANFVSLKLQMDSTNTDSEPVKAWYSEASRLGKEYGVRTYPTFLIFNPAGEFVHRITGASEVDVFMAHAKTALDPEKQDATLLQKYADHPNDTTVLRQMIDYAMRRKDFKLLNEVGDRYVPLMGAEYFLNEDNIDLLMDLANTIQSPAYQIIKENMQRVDKLRGGENGVANEILSSILLYEILPPLVSKSDTMDFKALEEKITKEHPYVAIRVPLLEQQAMYFYMSGDKKMNWAVFKKVVDELAMEHNSLPAPILYNYTEIMFSRSDDKSNLQTALSWSKKLTELNPENDSYLRLYANLLYKLGDKENGILWMEKALAMTSSEDLQTYSANLEKMRKGERTWSVATANK